MWLRGYWSMQVPSYRAPRLRPCIIDPLASIGTPNAQLGDDCASGGSNAERGARAVHFVGHFQCPDEAKRSDTSFGA